jgi:hypothetical protein
MTTPQQRLARMRKSFEKNKSVLTEDYKYFITPDKPANVSQPDKRGNFKVARQHTETLQARRNPTAFWQAR